MAAATNGFVIFDEKWFYKEECQTNLDVVGIGVIASYGLAALLATLLSVYAAALEIRHGKPNALFPKCCRRPISRALQRMTYLFSEKDQREYDEHRNLLDSLILLFGDQQLFTGFALLVSGYIEVFNGSSWSDKYKQLPSVYRLQEAHFHLIIYISYLSSCAILACLISTGGYLKDRQITHNIRLILCILFSVFLYITIIIAHPFPAVSKWLAPQNFHDVNGISQEKSADEVIADLRARKGGDLSPGTAFGTLIFGFCLEYPFIISIIQSLRDMEAPPWKFFRGCLGPRKPRRQECWILRIVVGFTKGNRTTAFCLQLIFSSVSAAHVLGQKLSKDPTGKHCTLKVGSIWGLGQTLAICAFFHLLYSAFNVYVGNKDKRRPSASTTSDPSSSTEEPDVEQGDPLNLTGNTGGGVEAPVQGPHSRSPEMVSKRHGEGTSGHYIQLELVSSRPRV